MMSDSFTHYGQPDLCEKPRMPVAFKLSARYLESRHVRNVSGAVRGHHLLYGDANILCK